MSDLLFDIPETKSPRLLWMDANRIRTYRNQEMAPQWMAIGIIATEDGGAEISERGDTEDDAMVALAKRLKIKLWNEN